MANNVIITLEHTNSAQNSEQGVKINKIISSISPLSFIKLLYVADNKINPRTASVNSITRAIDETLEKSPELFWYKTKGILIASKECEIVDSRRIKLTFDDPEFEGIMDGGHNSFAIARFIARTLLKENFKNWDECKDFWANNYAEILRAYEDYADKSKFEFSIPIEIITPTQEDGALNEYYNVIAEICSARNNNIQLKETAKGNQVGCYNYLKETLSNFPIIWKTGDPGKIKSENVLAMADMPLFYLQELKKLPDDLTKFNRVNLYSSKGQCVNFFNEVISCNQFSKEEKGKVVITSNLIKSALDMTKDIMTFFDTLYIKFPELYNANQGSFGKITSVKDRKSTPLFGTTNKQCKNTYPDGFIYPLIAGVYKLMEYDEKNDVLKWKINPASSEFTFDKLPLAKYIGWVKQLGYDPQKVGKTQLFYVEAADAFKAYGE